MTKNLEIYRKFVALLKATDLSGGLKQPPRPLHKGCFAAFSLGRVHPSFAKEGDYNNRSFVHAF